MFERLQDPTVSDEERARLNRPIRVCAGGEDQKYQLRRSALLRELRLHSKRPTSLANSKMAFLPHAKSLCLTSVSSTWSMLLAC